MEARAPAKAEALRAGHFDLALHSSSTLNQTRVPEV